MIPMHSGVFGWVLVLGAGMLIQHESTLPGVPCISGSSSKSPAHVSHTAANYCLAAARVKVVMSLRGSERVHSARSASGY
ncbi:hypothetical protein EJ04DRAFT_509889 [Polyplosphaeria fusca]|uniref:Secreted protein n=1 Tax=Polyplosphaeria fusca TaxID=682080 RepID=A0A9P4R2F2_9PLEO|nr:hypothetical protein EJ04DRAFT_509889 [Polyplosphaeria fusca]